jgi:uncharacterized membrane protein
MKSPLRIPILIAVLTAALALGAGAAPAQTGEEFVPWVTDFGRTPTPAPTVAPPASPAPAAGFRWQDAAIGAAGGAALALLAAGGAVAVRSRWQDAGREAAGSLTGS